MLRFLRGRYARARMTAYVNGALPPKTRRFVARVIDEDERCYSDYVAQRQVQDELHRALPLVGRPDDGQLDAIWQQINDELSTPEGSAVARRRSGWALPYPLGYGLAAAFLLLIFSLPYALNVGTVSASGVPNPPQRAQIVTEEAPLYQPNVTSTPSAVAYYTEMAGTQLARGELHNTPAAKTPGR